VTADLRIAYLQLLLSSLGATPPAERNRAQEYVRVLDRGQCSAASERLEVECLMTASRRWCANRGAHCNPLADAIISNLLAEKQLVPPERRYELSKKERDERRAVEREVERIAGALAVELRLRSGAPTDDDAELARRLDRFCLTSADASGLSWQACVSELAWFMRAR
jgi:hypothetical protein